MNFFTGKTVIVTGASSGIGKACVLEFAKRGANIVLAARNAAALENVAAQISSVSKSIAVATDVSHDEDSRNLVEAAIKNFGKIDVFINNARISITALFEESDIKGLKHVMEINF